jgi:hypothetical protein
MAAKTFDEFISVYANDDGRAPTSKVVVHILLYYFGGANCINKIYCC